jgi:hypothetical protein
MVPETDMNNLTLQRPLVRTVPTSGIVTSAFLASAAVLAAAVEHAISFALSPGLGHSMGRLVGVGVGAVLLGSLGGLTLLLPRRAIAVLEIALGCVLAVSLAGGILLAPGAMPLTIRFGRAALIATPLTFVALLALQAGIETHRAEVLVIVKAIVSEWCWLVLLASTLAATAIYVLASHRILFWDFAWYWNTTDGLADLIRQGKWQEWVRDVFQSVGDEYSLIPAVIPSLVTAPLDGKSLLGYQLAVAAFYLIPALLAVGALGLALARIMTPGMDSLLWPERVQLTTLGALAATLLLPHFVQVFLKYNMLDVGGVSLIVLLVFAWHRVLRVLPVSPPTHATLCHCWRVMASSASVTALSVLSFLFRRWYLFDVVGLAFAALCYLVVVAPRQARRWQDLLGNLALASCTAVLTLTATTVAILEQWLLQWHSRNYAEAYASYQADWSEMLTYFEGLFGLLIPALCGLFAIVLLRAARQRALPVMLVLGTVVAVLGFHQVQGPAWHHYYLIMPLLGGMTAAGTILLSRRIGPKSTLLILFAGGWFLGLASRQSNQPFATIQPHYVDLWPYHDPDADQLARLARWLDTALEPEERYCVLASGLAVNFSKLVNAWQVDPSLIDGKAAVWRQQLPEVDSRDGPPTDTLEHCSVMIVATPAQTHLHPSEQQSFLILANELLNSDGVGAAYDRLDNTYPLPSGATLLVFRKRRSIGDEAIRDLRRRFYESKGASAARYEARFGPP